MFLYRQTTQHHDQVMLYEDFEQAVADAITFVGEHNDIDGCSTVRQSQLKEKVFGSVYKTWRTTSFGRRVASVRPIFSHNSVATDAPKGSLVELD